MCIIHVDVDGCVSFVKSGQFSESLHLDKAAESCSDLTNFSWKKNGLYLLTLVNKKRELIFHNNNYNTI